MLPVMQKFSVEYAASLHACLRQRVYNHVVEAIFITSKQEQEHAVFVELQVLLGRCCSAFKAPTQNADQRLHSFRYPCGIGAGSIWSVNLHTPDGFSFDE